MRLIRAGYASEHSAYHHGENSLQDTIVNMAANYVGTNNINLLFPDGQFGTRLMVMEGSLLMEQRRFTVHVNREERTMRQLVTFTLVCQRLHERSSPL